MNENLNSHCWQSIVWFLQLTWNATCANVVSEVPTNYDIKACMLTWGSMLKAYVTKKTCSNHVTTIRRHCEEYVQAEVKWVNLNSILKMRLLISTVLCWWYISGTFYLYIKSLITYNHISKCHLSWPVFPCHRKSGLKI